MFGDRALNPMVKDTLFIRLLVLMVLSIFPGLAYAGGAYIYEFSSASETGYGGAGMAARANDAGTVFSNPAGMTRFDNTEMMAGGIGVYIEAPFSTNENNVATGKASGLNKQVVPAGSFGYIRPVSDKLKLGISAQNYWGLALNWGDDWVGREASVNMALLAPQLQPSVAYKVNDWLSVGAGAALTLGYFYDKARIPDQTGSGKEGKLTVSDTDFAVQGNLGVMLEPWEHTRIGLRYLTETELNFKDQPSISGIGTPSSFDPQSGLADPRDKIGLEFKMPQAVNLGIHHQWSDDLAILGSAGWEEWSRFGYVDVSLDLGSGGIREELNAGFRDVWHGGVGIEYQWNPAWEITAGFSYDSSMMSGGTRPIFIPLGSMYRYAVGFKHKKRDDLTLGGGFSFLWEGNLPVEDSVGVSGKYNHASLFFLSFYASWH